VKCKQLRLPRCVRAWQFLESVAVGRPIFRAERRTDSSPFKNFPIALLCFPIPHLSSQLLFSNSTAVFVNYTFNCLFLGNTGQTQKELHLHSAHPSLSSRSSACWSSRKIQVRLKNVKSHKAKNQPTRCFRRRLPGRATRPAVSNTVTITKSCEIATDTTTARLFELLSQSR
jgi:hypothetical protein